MEPLSWWLMIRTIEMSVHLFSSFTCIEITGIKRDKFVQPRGKHNHIYNNSKLKRSLTENAINIEDKDHARSGAEHIFFHDILFKQFCLLQMSLLFIVGVKSTVYWRQFSFTLSRFRYHHIKWLTKGRKIPKFLKLCSFFEKQKFILFFSINLIKAQSTEASIWLLLFVSECGKFVEWQM